VETTKKYYESDSKTVDKSAKWEQHPLEPRNEEEAKQFQAENLLLASRSGQVSRAISRVGSRIMSRRSSVQSSAMASRRQSVSSLYQASEATPPGGNQTLDNIRRVTDARDSFLNYRYRDENGDMIMVNLYDISDTDPADILGDDVVDVYDDEQEPQQQHFSAEELVKMVDPEEVEEFRMRRMMEEVMRQQEQLLQGESPDAEEDDHAGGQQQQQQQQEGAAAMGGEDIRSDPESEWDLHQNVRC